MWNYRVVRKKNTYIDPANKKKRVDYTYAIHEAYYDENGFVGAITQDPVEPFGENIEELRHSWVMMGEAFGQPILDYDNIPEPGYDRKEYQMGSALNERLKDLETSNKKEAAVPREDVKGKLEEQWGPFDHQGYMRSKEQERIEKDKAHNETFVGTPRIKDLIDKMYLDSMESIKKDKTENPWKYTPKDA